LFLALVYAVQRFWFVRAWSWIATLGNPNWRLGLHAGLIILAITLVAALLDPLLGRAVSRFTFGKSLITFASLWLVASFFGFLAVQSVGAVEYVTNLAARLAGIATPGAILIGPETARRLGERYSLQRLGQEQLKNIATPVEIYGLSGHRPSPYHGAEPAACPTDEQ